MYGIPGYELMCRAGEAALDSIRRNWPTARDITLLCGAGNNAGDGYVLARLALAAGYRVRVLSLVPAARLGGDARHAEQDFTRAGGGASDFDAREPLGGDLIVDALLGTGLDRAVEGIFADAVEAINAAGRPVLALDIPSGLNADSGMPLGCAVRADATVTFVGLKQGLFLGRGLDYRGRLELAELGVPAQAHADVAAPLLRLQRSCLLAAFPRRARTAHKGSHGSLLIVGGGPGMPGAVRLAAEAALRTGAGLVRVATHPAGLAAVGAGRPEIICHGLTRADELVTLIRQSDALVLGPGLGTDAWARDVWAAGIETELPLIVDADGLNLLAESPRRRTDWILTPHPGEAGRLLGCAPSDVQADRLAAVRQLASAFGATAVLKGAGTLVADAADGPVGVCDLGNPGMATAGMGDVLAGVIGGALAQGIERQLAAEAGVYLHAAAGDVAAQEGERGLLAGDLMPFIRRSVNPAR